MGHVNEAIDYRLRQVLPRPAYRIARRRYYGARALVGRNPGRGRVEPDFIIIGAAKSGTTSLYADLGNHPFVVPCVTGDAWFLGTKEVHYFDYNFDRGPDWYRSHFPLEHERREFTQRHGEPFLTGEASPSYISHPWTPERVREALPNVKLIALFRDPVERAYSHFAMSRREGVEPLESFEDALAQEEERLAPEIERMQRDPGYNSWNFGCWSYLARSRYAEQVERWLPLFPREQFLFLKAEDLFARPAETLETTFHFLGLPPQPAPEGSRLHTATYAPLEPATRTSLEEYFRPHNERLSELTGADFAWDSASASTAV